MYKLNTASYEIWQLLFKDEDKRNIHSRILELDSQGSLSDDELKEIELLLKLEKKYLNQTELIIIDDKKIIRKFNFYKKKLEKDERLLTLYFDRINEAIDDNKYNTEEDVSNIYHNLMKEDSDVEGHELLTKYYNELNELHSSSDIGDDFNCGYEDCLYCRPITDEEINFAYDDLNATGDFEVLDEDVRNKMIELMIIIHRLEDELRQFKDFGCMLNDEDLEDEDEED